MNTKYPQTAKNNPTIVSIPRIVNTFRMRPKMSSSNVIWKQFPLRPNTAITIHRSQGRTIPQGTIDLSKATISGMHYVALSRFPNLSNIWIMNLESDKIKVDQGVVQEMKRLRIEKQLTLACRPIDNIPKPKLRIMFQNVRSLRKHFEDIISNKEFQSADVVVFDSSFQNVLLRCHPTSPARQCQDFYKCGTWLYIHGCALLRWRMHEATPFSHSVYSALGSKRF